MIRPGKSQVIASLLRLSELYAPAYAVARVSEGFRAGLLARLSGSTGAPPEDVLATALSLIARGLIHSDLTEHEMGFSSIVWMN